MKWFGGIISTLLLVSAIGLLGLTLMTHITRWDALTAWHNIPVWIPGITALVLAGLAHLFLDAKFSITVCLLWVITILSLSDEFRVISNFGTSKPVPSKIPKVSGLDALRVVTLNCGHSDSAATINSIAEFRPDIIFLQETIDLRSAQQLKQELFGDKGDLRRTKANFIIARGKLDIPKNPTSTRALICTLTLENGRTIDLVNLHLSSNTKRLDLWKKAAWNEHRSIRDTQRDELNTILDALRERQPNPSKVPCIIGGDFNAIAASPVLDLLQPGFTNAYNAKGKGWANTFPARFPIIRIDHIFLSQELIPGRSAAFQIIDTDHRMLVTDFAINSL